MDFMSLLGGLMGGGLSPSSSSRAQSAGNSVQDLLGGLLGKAGSAVGGNDNLAAAGIGALLGALTGRSQSTTANSLGGGAMGLLGMMAYKALKNSMSGGAQSQAVENYEPENITPQQQNSDAEIIIIAMIDAAKADGQVDPDELTKIMTQLKSSGVGQEGVNYVMTKLRSPMETNKIIAATKNRPDLATQVYSASLMAIEVDTDAERKYLDNLARSMGLNSNIVRQIEQMTNTQNTSYMC